MGIGGKDAKFGIPLNEESLAKFNEDQVVKLYDLMMAASTKKDGDAPDQSKT